MATGAEMHAHKMEERKLEKQKAHEREEHVVSFIEKVLHQRPQGDFEHWIRDAVILSKLMTAIVFNSVPMEDIKQNWGSDAARDRARGLIREMVRYGVHDTFEPEDLVEMKNIDRVTKCVDELAELADKREQNLASMAS